MSPPTLRSRSAVAAAAERRPARILTDSKTARATLALLVTPLDACCDCGGGHRGVRYNASLVDGELEVRQAAETLRQMLQRHVETRVDFCNDDATYEEVRRLCPATCGLCDIDFSALPDSTAISQALLSCNDLPYTDWLDEGCSFYAWNDAATEDTPACSRHWARLGGQLWGSAIEGRSGAGWENMPEVCWGVSRDSASTGLARLRFGRTSVTPAPLDAQIRHCDIKSRSPNPARFLASPPSGLRAHISAHPPLLRLPNRAGPPEVLKAGTPNRRPGRSACVPVGHVTTQPF